jgi:metal-dependent amidase/aminoacylase/carboxypeptidase family protein
VVTVCAVNSGNNSNVIPARAELQGTVRFHSLEVGDAIRENIRRMVKAAARAGGVRCRLTYRRPYLPTVNAAEAVDIGRRVVSGVFGKTSWVELREPTLGAEDFCYYLVKHPGALFRIGMGRTSAPLHNPHFDFNDRALRNGMLFLVNAALEALSGRGG